MKTSLVLFISVMLLTLTGCGSTNCNLSSLKIKEVKIEGDEGGYVRRAIMSRLFQNGARRHEGGVEIIGFVELSAAKVPIRASVEVPKMSFASTAISRVPEKVFGAEEIARIVALDFCRCAESVRQQ